MMALVAESPIHYIGLLTIKTLHMKNIITALAFCFVSATTTAIGTQQPKQCQATTKAGTQCLRHAQAGADYCYQHNPKAQAETSVCGAKTKAGHPCQNRVKVDGQKCHLHK